MAQEKCRLCRKEIEPYDGVLVALCSCCTKKTEATAPQPVSPSKSSDLLKRKDALNDSFRMIISHRMMGYECKMEKEDFDGMLSDLVDSAVALDWDGYKSWVSDWCLHPGFDFALIPDKIDGDEGDNRRLVDGWHLGEHIGVPVWHLHESLPFLRWMTQCFSRVAFGSSGDYAKIGTAKWWNRMAEAMNYICDGLGRPPCKLHGLRMLDPAVFTRFPFASCDSTNVAQNCKDSKRWTVYNPPNNETRGLVLAERIEAQNSASVWVEQPVQMAIGFCV